MTETSSGGTALKVIVITAIALVVACAACCVGCGGLTMMGFKMQEAQVQAALSDNPVITEHLGEVKDVSFSLSETITAAERQAGAATSPGGFDVQGSKGDGVVWLSLDASSGEVEIVDGVLRLPDGTEHPLVE